MAQITTFYEGQGVDIIHQLCIPKDKIDAVIIRLQEAKAKNEDIILPTETITVFLNWVRSADQARIGFDGPKTFKIGPLYNSKPKAPPHTRGIAG